MSDETTPPRSATLIALAQSTGFGYEEWERALTSLGLDKIDAQVLDVIAAMCSTSTGWTPTKAATALVQLLEDLR